MTIKALHQLFLASDAISTDTRKVAKNDMFFALKGEHFNGNKFAKQALENGAKYALIDEENYLESEKTILVDDVLQTLQKLAAFHRQYLNIPILALTGSNGKTTTKELINTCLSQKYQTTATLGNLNNHIGVPLTLLSMTSDTEIGIVEMGANHLKEIEFLCEIAQPDFGYITNFGKAHLEGFGSLEGVVKAKTELYQFLVKHNKTIFINTDDPKQVTHSSQANTISFGKGMNNDCSIIYIEAQPFVKLEYNGLKIQSQLIGSYNFNNIAAAIAIAHYFEVPDVDIKSAIEAYSPKNNRSQIIEKGTNQIILDAYNANPTSMQAALTNFHTIQAPFKMAILGDMFELGTEAEKEHQHLVSFAEELDIDALVFIGENFFKTKSSKSKIKRYPSFEAYTKDISELNLNEASLLIKGSRGMALERILDLI